MTFTTAVVGGGSGAENHLSGVQECPHAELVAVCDPDETRASELATEYDINAYADFEGLLARESLDWIHLCTPVETHLELARMAIEDGIPVLIAEPVTESVPEAEELARLAEAYDATVSVGHPHDFSPAMRETRRRVEEGAIGALRSVDLLYAGEFEAMLPDPIYVMLNLGGSPSSLGSVQANTSTSDESPPGFEYDSAQFQYTTDDGVLCSATVLDDDVPRKVVQVHGDRGSLEVDVASQSVTVLDRDGRPSPESGTLAPVDTVLDSVRSTAETLAAVAGYGTDGDRGTAETLDAHSSQFCEEVRAIQWGGPAAVPVTEGTWTLRIMERLSASATDPKAVPAAPVNPERT